MPKKTWEATDLKMGRIEFERTVIEENDSEYPGIIPTRYYQLMRPTGEVLTDMAGRGITMVVKWTELPVDIQGALQKIDAHTYQKAKEKEGLV